MPYGRLDIRKFSIKIAGANLWNSLQSFVKNAQSIHIFKKNMRHYLAEKKGTRKGLVKGCVSLDPSKISKSGRWGLQLDT